MRFFATAMVVALMATAPAAHATENRIHMTDIHSFVAQMNSAVNSPNLDVSRSFLDRTIAQNALFENTVASYNAVHPYHRVWYANPAYGYYYRYPANPYYAPVSNQSMKKWDHITLVENKKRMIPGYQSLMNITNTVISPYGGGAVIDVDMKEYSLAYSPYTPTLTQAVLNANSKCRLYVDKLGDDDIVLSRMDCNTNTNLPF